MATQTTTTSPTGFSSADQARLDAILQAHNYTPPTQGSGGGSSQNWRSLLQEPAPSTNVVSETAQNYMGNVAPAAKDITGAFNAFTGADKGVPQGSIAEGAAQMSKGGLGNIAGGIGKATLGTAAHAVQAIFAPIAAPIQTLLAHTDAANKAQEQQTGVPTPGTEGLNTPQAQAARKQLSDWAQAHPDIAKTLSDAFTVGTAVVGSEGLNVPVSDAIQSTKSAVEQGISTVKGGAQATKEAVGGVRDLVSPPKTPTELAGKITQAEPQDIPAATRALGTVDTTGVKTFKDLSAKLDAKIKENTASVDTELGKDTTPRKIQTLATPVKVGESTIYHNYVVDAIKQLKDFYAKTNDVKGLAKMNAYEAKIDPVKGQGLTLKEVNDIARLHGQDLNAYNASGELASGLTKQSAENTRQGLKETVRSQMTNDTTRGIDKSTSDLIRTKGLVDDMATKVQKLQNKFEKAGLIQKAGTAIGKGVDLMTGGLFKGLFKSLTGMGGTGGRTLNAIEIEQQLAKNLKLLEKLDTMKPEDAVKELQSMQ